MDKLEAMLAECDQIAKSSDNQRERVYFGSVRSSIADLNETQATIYLKFMLDARNVRKFHAEQNDLIKSNRQHSIEHKIELSDRNQIEMFDKLNAGCDRIKGRCDREIAQLKAPMLKEPAPLEGKGLIDYQLLLQNLLTEPDQARRERRVSNALSNGDDSLAEAVLNSPQSLEVVHTNFRGRLKNQIDRARYPENFAQIERWEKLANLVHRYTEGIKSN